MLPVILRGVVEEEVVGWVVEEEVAGCVVGGKTLPTRLRRKERCVVGGVVDKEVVGWLWKRSWEVSWKKRLWDGCGRDHGRCCGRRGCGSEKLAHASTKRRKTRVEPLARQPEEAEEIEWNRYLQRSAARRGGLVSARLLGWGGRARERKRGEGEVLRHEERKRRGERGKIRSKNI